MFELRKRLVSSGEIVVLVVEGGTGGKNGVHDKRAMVLLMNIRTTRMSVILLLEAMLMTVTAVFRHERTDPSNKDDDSDDDDNNRRY